MWAKYLPAALLLACAPCTFAGASLPETQVLLISDIHFDPTANNADMNRLIAARPGEWAAVLAQATPVQLPAYGNDTNWWLLTSALSYIKSTSPEPAFILITGDFLAHHFQEKFKKAAPRASDKSYREFVRKTMEFLGAQLEQTFPRTPILSALGNNDNDGADYSIQPRGYFLRASETIVRDMTDDTADKDFSNTWLPLGSYSAHIPSLPGYRLLSLNTNFLATKYRSNTTAPEKDPGAELLNWLDKELAAAEQAHEKVWLIYHVPPGIDGFATNRACSHVASQPCQTIVTMWKPRYLERFESILAAHPNCVQASFAGHTHMDEFRLIGNNRRDGSFVLLTPAISPSNGENPAFRKLLVAADGTLSNAETYYLDLTTAATIEFPAWKPEYSFRADWSVPQIDWQTLHNIYTASSSTLDSQEKWARYYSVLHQSLSELGPRTFRALHCALGAVNPANYSHCYAGQ